MVEEEELWTEVIERYESVKAEWGSDIVSRAYGNRGNARSRQVPLLLRLYMKTLLNFDCNNNNAGMLCRGGLIRHWKITRNQLFLLRVYQNLLAEIYIYSLHVDSCI